jgi:Tol biopolymer transport system component/DNA-binding winged helix-turn-helix (wHTH) protein
MSWGFGECELDRATRELTRDGQPVSLTPKALLLLELLLERHPAAVSRDEIRDVLWPDTAVADSNLASLVWELRSAIGDTPPGRFVRTVRGFGYAFSGDVQPLGAQHAPGSGDAARRGERGLRAVALVSLTVLGAIGGLWLGSTSHSPAPATPSIRPVTSFPGEEWAPALSHDGDHLAYVRAPEGVPNLYVTLLGLGEPLLLARDALGPAWTPDDRQIAFVRHREGDGEARDDVFLVPALGGEERHLATVSMGHSHTLSFSPDGRQLALAHRDAPDAPIGLHLLSLETAGIRRLTRPPPGHFGDADPSFSPDGRRIAFTRVEALGVSDLYLVAAEGGEPRRLTRGNHNTQGVSWAPDGESLAFAAVRMGGGSPFALWRVSVSGGEPVRLEFGEHGMRPTASREGGRLAYVRQELQWDIWRVGGPAAPEDERVPTRLISSTSVDYFPSYSPDGREIGFASLRSGAQEIWVCDADGTNPRQLTFLGTPLTGGAVWSPRGRRIAFNSPRAGSQDIYVMDRAGGTPRRLTSDPAIDRAGSWSPDGRWIYFHSNRSGRNEVWRVPAQGGEPLQVTTQGGVQALASSDGRFVYHVRHDALEGVPGVWRTGLEDGEEVQVMERGLVLRWDLLDDGIVFLDDGGPDTLGPDGAPPTLAFFDFATGEVSHVATTPNGAPWGISVSPDRRWVIYTGWEPPEADIMLVEGFR